VTDAPAHATLTENEGGSVTNTLPVTRPELLVLHAEARRRRAAAPLGGGAYRAACEDIAKIEVRIAEIEIATGAGTQKG
jgi:hypothetical protein